MSDEGHMHRIRLFSPRIQKDIKGSETIRFMALASIPKDHTVKYARIIVDYCLQEEDYKRLHIMVGGNLIAYPYKLTTQTADLTNSKVTWNIIISILKVEYTRKVVNFFTSVLLSIGMNTCKYLSI